MTHRGPFQPRPFCDSVKRLRDENGSAAGPQPSLSPSTHRVHREGEAFLGGGRETRSKLALHEGFPLGPAAQSFYPSRADGFGQQRRLSRTARRQSPGWAAHQPRGKKQRARPQPRAGEGTRQASRRTQAPCSSLSFTGSPLPGPGKGMLQRWQDPSLQPEALSLSLCSGPRLQSTIVCAGPEQGRGLVRAGCCVRADFHAHQPLEAAPDLQPPSGTAAKPFPESKGGESRCQPRFPLSDPGKPRSRQQLGSSGC